MLTELRSREFHEKPTAERKRKLAAAVKRNHKRLRSRTLPPKPLLDPVRDPPSRDAMPTLAGDHHAGQGRSTPPGVMYTNTRRPAHAEATGVCLCARDDPQSFVQDCFPRRHRRRHRTLRPAQEERR